MTRLGLAMEQLAAVATFPPMLNAFVDDPERFHALARMCSATPSKPILQLIQGVPFMAERFEATIDGCSVRVSCNRPPTDIEWRAVRP